MFLNICSDFRYVPGKDKMKFLDFLPLLWAHDFDEVLGFHNREETWEKKNLNILWLLVPGHELNFRCSSKECPEKGKPQRHPQLSS